MSSAMYSVSKYGCWNASCSKSATPSSSLEFGPYHHPLACGLRGLPRASASLSACSEFLCKFASGWGGGDDGISALLLPVSLWLVYARDGHSTGILAPNHGFPFELGGKDVAILRSPSKLGTLVFLTFFLIFCLCRTACEILVS